MCFLGFGSSAHLVPSSLEARGGGAAYNCLRSKITYADLGLACLSAVLLILSFPKFDLSALAWVSLVPLLVALEGKSAKQAFVLSHLAGVVFFESLFYWMWTVPGWNLVDSALVHVIYLPLYISLWGLSLNWIRNRTGLPATLVAPPLWVTCEYLRSNASFLSLPWMFLGHSQYAHPALIQVTSLTGVYGVSFLIVLANAAIAEAAIYLRRRWSEPGPRSPLPRSLLLSLGATGCLLVASLFYGLSVLSKGVGDERATVALVQGNIPQEQKWDRGYRQMILTRYRELTVQAVRQAPSLIIWPETAVPGDIRHQPDLQRALAQVALDTNTHLLVGTAEQAKFKDRKLEEEKYYNSLVLLTPEGRITGEYRKTTLVPFAEYVPLKDIVRWPKAVVSAAMGNLVPGNHAAPFSVGGVPFRAIICWEIIFPDLFRRFVNDGAAFMVVATNEAWFGDTSAPYQLLAMSVFRAAENRIAIARSANTGVTALIDPFGRITHRLTGPDQKDLFIEGVLVAEIPLAREHTFYTQHGDVFAFLQIFVSILMVFLALKGAGPVAQPSSRS